MIYNISFLSALIYIFIFFSSIMFKAENIYQYFQEIGSLQHIMFDMFRFDILSNL